MVTFLAHGQAIGVYLDGIFQTYWRPTDGLGRLVQIVTFLRS